MAKAKKSSRTTKKQVVSDRDDREIRSQRISITAPAYWTFSDKDSRVKQIAKYLYAMQTIGLPLVWGDVLSRILNVYRVDYNVSSDLVHRHDVVVFNDSKQQALL